MEIRLPEGKSRLLLHCCCAPCSGAIVECLDRNGIKPILYYSNSNIDTREEYDKRLAELKRYAEKFGLDVVDDEYDHSAWRAAVAGLEGEQERGARCARCFEFRLSRAAAFAKAHGYDVISTTLASSRWKSLEQVDAAGQKECPDLYWAVNWRKGGLQPRRGEIIREWNFYNQTWCGCEFSHRQDNEK